MTENERRYSESQVYPSRMAKCKGCGKLIIWMKTERGKNMPVNPVRLSYKEGNISLLDKDGKLHIHPKVGQDGWQTHWETCSEAEQFKRPQQ